MSDRKDFFFRQKVTEAELDGALDDLENADLAQVTDANAEGVWFGLGVAENGLGQDESVDVAAGAAYDQLGQRMFLASLQNVDVSVDNVSASTQVGSGGNEKLIGVYLKFDRVLSDPRVDGNSITVFFERDESFEFVVRQGPEEAAPATTFPALQADEILLADVRRVFADNTIADADVETTRRENSWVQTIGETPGVAASEVAFTPGATWATINTIAATDVQALGDEIVSDIANAGAGVNVAGAYNMGVNVTQNWADATGLVALNMGALMEELVGDLVTASPNAGAGRIGAGIYAGVGTSLAAGTIESQLQELADELGGLAAANTWSAINTFSDDINLDGVIDHDGAAIFSTGAGIDFDADDNANTTIRRIIQSGTGASVAAETIVKGQDGRAQTGATLNNDGGVTVVEMGAPGAGGSLTTGGGADGGAREGIFEQRFSVGGGIHQTVMTVDNGVNGVIAEQFQIDAGSGNDNTILIEIVAHCFEFLGVGRSVEIGHYIGKNISGSTSDLLGFVTDHQGEDFPTTSPQVDVLANASGLFGIELANSNTVANHLWTVFIQWWLL